MLKMKYGFNAPTRVGASAVLLLAQPQTLLIFHCTPRTAANGFSSLRLALSASLRSDKTIFARFAATIQSNY